MTGGKVPYNIHCLDYKSYVDDPDLRDEVEYVYYMSVVAAESPTQVRANILDWNLKLAKKLGNDDDSEREKEFYSIVEPKKGNVAIRKMTYVEPLYDE